MIFGWYAANLFRGIPSQDGAIDRLTNSALDKPLLRTSKWAHFRASGMEAHSNIRLFARSD